MVEGFPAVVEGHHSIGGIGSQLWWKAIPGIVEGYPFCDGGLSPLW